MSVRERLAPYVEDVGGDGVAGVGLTVVAVVTGALLVFPIAWLVVDVFGLGPRALELTVAPTTVEVLLRSVALVAVVTGASVLVGVPLAVLTAQTDLPFKRFWTIVVALPLVIPSYLGAFAAVSAFGPRGALADVFGVGWLPTIYGFAGAAAVLTLYTYPYVFLTTRASLLSLDASLIEAARTLDCSRREAFRRITLPQIAPGIAAGSLLVALYTLSDFGTPNIMHVEVFTQFIYARYDGFMSDYVALLSLELLAVTAIILALESRIGADDSGAYSSRGTRGKTRISLGRWRYPLTLLPVGIATLAIVLPVGIFAMWLTRGGPGYDAGGLAFDWLYGFNSVAVSILAAGAAVLVALPLAYRSATGESWLARLFGRVTYAGYATPGIVLAIALVGFSLEVLPAPLYKSLPLLIFAYVVRFMPQAMGSIQASVLQIDPRLVEAARTMGRSRLSAFRSVTLPLIAPGIASGAALVFLTTMKELPVTLILRPLRYQLPFADPIHFETLVTYIWRVQETGAYGHAAIPALVLVLASSLSMAVILAQEGSGT